MDEPPCIGLQPSKFEKGENARFQGMVYQTNLTTFCLIQAFKRFKDWKLSSENVEADTFDDVVVESSTGDFLMQVKYRKNEITFNDLLSTNPKDDSFALAKYFQSFQRVKTKFQVTDLAICTNANIMANEIEEEFLTRENATSDSLLYYQGRECTFYTFNASFMPILKGLIREYLKNSKTKGSDTDTFTDEDIIEFLRYLRLYYDYPCQKELINAMERSLPLVRLSHNVLKRISVQDITFKVIEWYENPRGDCEYLTEFRLSTIFSEMTHTDNQASTGFGKFKKGGDVGISSMMFHVKLTTVTLLRALEEFPRFRLSFKNLLADKFDNIIVEWYGGNLAIQTKYKESKKVTFNELLSVGLCNNGFSLPKYFLSYQKVKTRFRELDVVMCTNANITMNRSNQRYFKRQNATSESLLYSQGRECSFYTFEETVVSLLQKHIREYFRNLTNNNETIDEELITDDNIKIFLGRVRFHCDYPLDVKSDIDNSLGRLSLFSDIFSNVTHEDIISKVMEWFEQPRGSCEYITENSAITMFSEIKSNKFRDKLDQYNVLFTNNDLMFDGTKRIFYVPFEKEYLLPVIKTLRVLQANNLKALYVNPDLDTVVRRHILQSFEHPSYHYLIIIWPKILHRNALIGMYRKLRNTLVKYEYKNVVLVSKTDSLMRQFVLGIRIFQTIDLRIELNDFLIETQTSLLNKRKVVFDGNLTSVGEILASKTYNHFIIPPNILCKLIRDEEIVVTVCMHDMDVNGSNRKVLMLAKEDSELLSPMILTEESQGLVFELK